MTQPTRPAPDLTEPDTAPFWSACARHELTYQLCTACGAAVSYRRPFCTRCGGDLADAVSAGTGTVYSHTTIRKHGDPFFRSQLPYLVAVVDLDEGFRLLVPMDVGQLSVEDVYIGRRVEVGWEDHETWSMPVFRLLG